MPLLLTVFEEHRPALAEALRQDPRPHRVVAQADAFLDTVARTWFQRAEVKPATRTQAGYLFDVLKAALPLAASGRPALLQRTLAEPAPESRDMMLMRRGLVGVLLGATLAQGTLVLSGLAALLAALEGLTLWRNWQRRQRPALPGKAAESEGLVDPNSFVEALQAQMAACDLLLEAREGETPPALPAPDSESLDRLGELGQQLWQLTTLPEAAPVAGVLRRELERSLAASALEIQAFSPAAEEAFDRRPPLDASPEPRTIAPAIRHRDTEAIVRRGIVAR